MILAARPLSHDCRHRARSICAPRGCSISSASNTLTHAENSICKMSRTFLVFSIDFRQEISNLTLSCHTNHCVIDLCLVVARPSERACVVHFLAISEGLTSFVPRLAGSSISLKVGLGGGAKLGLIPCRIQIAGQVQLHHKPLDALVFKS